MTPFQKLQGYSDRSVDAVVGVVADTDILDAHGLVRSMLHNSGGMEFWREVHRVMKPGGHLAVVTSTDFDLVSMRIRLAEFEVRDALGWFHDDSRPFGPGFIPVILARRPLEGTVAENVARYGTGALNIDASRIPAEKPTGWGGGAAGGRTWTPENTGLAKPGNPRPVDGRWPTNILHDTSPAVMARFDAYGERQSSEERGERGTGGIWSAVSNKPCGPQYGDTGSVARFFGAAVDQDMLLQWLIRLVLPPGGTLVNPFE